MLASTCLDSFSLSQAQAEANSKSCWERCQLLTAESPPRSARPWQSSKGVVNVCFGPVTTFANLVLTGYEETAQVSVLAVRFCNAPAGFDLTGQAFLRSLQRLISDQS